MAEPWLVAGTVRHGRTLAGGVSIHRYVSWLMLKNKIHTITDKYKCKGMMKVKVKVKEKLSVDAP